MVSQAIVKWDDYRNSMGQPFSLEEGEAYGFWDGLRQSTYLMLMLAWTAVVWGGVESSLMCGST